MRLALALVVVVAACGGNSGKSPNPDGNNNGLPDGNGGCGSGCDAPNLSTNVSVVLVNRPNTPATFMFIAAYQDGAGAWMPAPAPSGDTYTFPISSPAWGFAWTCAVTSPAGISTREVHELHFAVGERTSITELIPQRCSDHTPTTYTLTGTVTNRQQPGPTLIQFGMRGPAATNNASTYTLETPSSTHDLLAVHGAFGASAGDFAADAVYVQRALAVNANTTASFDFGNAAATQSFPVSGFFDNGMTHAAQTTLYTAKGTAFTLVRTTSSTGISNFTTQSLDATQMNPADVYDQQMSEGDTTGTVTVSNATTAPAAETFFAPASLTNASATIGTMTPYDRIKLTWDAYAGAIGYTWTGTQTLSAQECNAAGPCTNTWTAVLSPGVVGTVAPSFQMADLAMPGFDAKLEFATGKPVDGFVEAMTSTGGASDFPARTPAAGVQRVFARGDFSVTPP